MRKLTDVFSTCWERLDDDDTDVRAAREQAIGKLAPLRDRAARGCHAQGGLAIARRDCAASGGHRCGLSVRLGLLHAHAKHGTVTVVKSAFVALLVQRLLFSLLCFE